MAVEPIAQKRRLQKVARSSPRQMDLGTNSSEQMCECPVKLAPERALPSSRFLWNGGSSHRVCLTMRPFSG